MMSLKDKVNYFFALKKSTTGKESFAIIAIGGFLVAFAIYSIADYIWSNLRTV